MQQLAVFSTSDAGGIDELTLSGLIRAADVTSIGGVRLNDDAITCLTDGVAGGLAYEVAIHQDVDQNSENSTDALLSVLRPLADTAGIDVNIIPADGRRKRLLIADMDSTIITSESLDDMAVMAGLDDKVLPVTRRAMNGELDFTAALDERIALFAGQPASLMSDALAESSLTAGAQTLVRTMKANGARCYLISGGFTAITGPISAACGFDGHHANVLDVADNRLTGTVARPILDGDAKLQFMNRYCAELGLDHSEVAAVGDGSNDLAMLSHAGLGVAFHGKPTLRQTIGIQLNQTDLTGLLYLQGYRQQDFVTG